MDRTKYDMTEQKKLILEQLRQKGCRITKQREVLIDVILREKCNNCKEIYYMAAKEDPDIGMATVYRMMNTLEEIGALKWRNEYTICEQEDPAIHICKVEFEDVSSMELKGDILHHVIEKGLDSLGYLKGRKVRRILVLEK